MLKEKNFMMKIDASVISNFSFLSLSSSRLKETKKKKFLTLK